MDKTKLWTANLVIIIITNFLTFFAFLLFPTALPPYLKTLGASDNIIGWMQWILTATTLLMRPFTGMAIDKFGRRGIFFIGLVSLMLSSGAYYFFPTVGIIILIRAIHGIAWGIANTACSTVASDNVEKVRFAEGMGYVSLASGIAMASAPAVALSISVKNCILVAFAACAFCLLLSFAIKYKKQPDSRNAVNIKVSPYAKESVMPSCTVFFVTTTYGALVTFLAIYGAEKSMGNIALFFAAHAVSMLVTRPFVGKLVDRKGYSYGVWPGFTLAPAGLVLLSVSNSLAMLIICAILFGIGMGSAQTSMQAMAIIRAPKERTGAANATFFSFFDGGVGVGALVAGFLSTAFGYGNMFALMAISPILGGVLYFTAIYAQKRAGNKQKKGVVNE